MTRLGGARLGNIWGRGPSLRLITGCLSAGATVPYLLPFPAAHTLGGRFWSPALHQAEGFSPSWGPGGNPCPFHVQLAKPRIRSTLSKSVRGKCHSAEKLRWGWGGVKILHHSHLGFFPLPPLCLIKRTPRGSMGFFWATILSQEALPFPVSSSCLSSLL